MYTKFSQVYNCFYSKITDDMYMELDEQQTRELTRELLINSLHWFEFPRVDIYNYNEDAETFNIELSREEINIIATYMMIAWFDQQLASVELVRMKFSGSDFKFTSQANHMSKLLALKKDYERTGFHLQRLYKRRKADSKGVMKSTLGNIMSTSVRKNNAPRLDTVPSCDCDGEIEWNDFPVEETPKDDSWESMGDEESKNETGEDFWESM